MTIMYSCVIPDLIGDPTILQRRQSLLRRFKHLLRHTGHSGNMKTEAVSHTTFHQFAQEDDILAHLLHRNMEILYARIDFFKIVEFMIMSGEKSLGSVTIFVDIFNYRTCDGHSVVGRRSSADLIKEYQ